MKQQDDFMMFGAGWRYAQCPGWLMLMLFLVLPILSFAQSEPEQYKSRMSLSADQMADGSLLLHGLVRARIEGVYQKISSVEVSFLALDSLGDEHLLGKATTGSNGVADYLLKTYSANRDAEGFTTFMARFPGDESYTESESDIRLRPAKLIVTPHETDSTYTLAIRAVSMDGEEEAPIGDASVSVYVKRMFSELKVGEASTDEDGSAEIEFPTDLAGDADANLMITAKVVETEEFGNLVSTTILPWGAAVSDEVSQLPRALWSPHPPVWMIVTFFVLMGTVWVHYLIIVLKLVRVKREGRTIA